MPYRDRLVAIVQRTDDIATYVSFLTYSTNFVKRTGITGDISVQQLTYFENVRGTITLHRRPFVIFTRSGTDFPLEDVIQQFREPNYFNIPREILSGKKKGDYVCLNN